MGQRMLYGRVSAGQHHFMPVRVPNSINIHLHCHGGVNQAQLGALNEPLLLKLLKLL